MYDLEPKRKIVASSGAAFVLCLLAMYIGVTTMGQNEIIAQDKSTSITCTGEGPCEKIECINDDCQTFSTNSSNISSTTGSDAKELDKQKSFGDSLRERLNMRGD
jgi:hypothetical protein